MGYPNLFPVNFAYGISSIGNIVDAERLKNSLGIVLSHGTKNSKKTNWQSRTPPNIHPLKPGGGFVRVADREGNHEGGSSDFATSLVVGSVGSCRNSKPTG